MVTQKRSKPDGVADAEQPRSTPTDDPSIAPVDTAAVEFLDKMHGTLQELITTRDLETLNAGLSFFFSDLRRARELFQQSEGHGRSGAIKALGAMWRFIALFKEPLAECLHVPILRLQSELRALDQNTVSPILRPVGERGRGSSTDARAALIGRAAGAVAQLVEAGLARPEARTWVAKALVELGVRPERGSGEMTERTVREWCERVDADVGRHEAAATVYDGMFTADERQTFADLGSDEARRSYALQGLARFVRAVFPRPENSDFPKPQKST